MLPAMPQQGHGVGGGASAGATPDRSPGAAPRTGLPNLSRRTLAELPCPRGLPLLGNLLDFKPGQFHVALERWARQLGPCYTFRFGRRRVLVISDAEVIESVLRPRPDTFRRLSKMEKIFEELGIEGVFSSEGDSWRRQRRLAVEALSSRFLQNFYPTLCRIAMRLRTRWARTAGLPIDVVDDLRRFTVDVTTNLAFSLDVNTLEGQQDVIERHLERIFPAIDRRLTALVPYWRYFELAPDRALNHSLAEIRGFLATVISDTRRKLSLLPDEQRQPTNFLEAMLLARDESGAPFSDSLISGNALTMLLAGEDTTACTLAWLVHEIADRPQVLSRLRAEVAPLLPSAEGSLPPLEALSRLPYVDAVLNETMRVRPVAPLLFLEANVDTEVAGIAVPRGTFVVTLLRQGASDPQHFPEPDSFDPDRWLAAPDPQVLRSQRTSKPFGSGPRICPGRTLALVEMRMVTALLVHHFEIERRGAASDVTERFAFTLAPDGLDVRLTPRRSLA